MKKAKRLQRPIVAPTVQRPLVEANPEESKSGCLWCPLLPMSTDFAALESQYNRDGDKIIRALKEPHSIQCRCVSDGEYNEVDVMFIGDAPGAAEDKQGVPFTGRAGSMLRKVVESVFGLPQDRWCCSTLVRCRPPLNRKPTKTEIKSCEYELIREIQARKPKVVVALGNAPLDFLAGQTGITTFCGRSMRCIRPEFPDLIIVACVNPSYVLRMDHEAERFADAMYTAAQLLSGEITTLPSEGEYFVLDNLQDVQAVLEGFVEDGVTVAFDTETGSLTPFQSEFPPLLCFSFSNREGEGCTIPFDHKDAPWTRKDHAKVADALRWFFDTCGERGIPLIAQNEKFDRNHIRKALDLVLPVPFSDTMTTHMTLDERRGSHSLKTIAYAYTGMGGYEKPLDDYVAKHKEANPDKGGSYANIPGKILFPYAAMDADCSLRCHNAMREDPEYVKNEKFQVLAEVFFPDLGATLADLEYNGAEVDSEVVADLDKHYCAEMERVLREIHKLPKIRKFVANEKCKGGAFNPDSPKQLQTVLFDYYGLRPLELTDTGFSTLVARHQRLQKSNPDLSFSDVVKNAVERRQWAHFTTKADVLHEYERMGNELAPLVLQYREASTLYGTFVVPLRDQLREDGRLHGTYNTTGTVTGRLSSRDPNLQNIPNKGGGRIKRAYISRFEGGVLLQADYSQVELRVAASYFNEPEMIRAYVNELDLHTLTAVAISGLSDTAFAALSKKQQKEWRTRAKRVNFGILYGGGPPALQSTLKKDGVHVTVDECRDLIETYFKKRKALKRGIQKLEKQVRKTGYLETFTGRMRRVPEVYSNDEKLVSRALRQVINFPIQSTASDMTLMSLVLINRILKREGYESQVILTVHDSIVIDTPAHETLEVAELAKYIMENLPELSDEVLPGLSWDWLKVPIVAEFEVGRSWGTLVDLDLKLMGSEAEGELIGLDEDGKEKALRAPVSEDELWELVDWRAQQAA